MRIGRQQKQKPISKEKVKEVLVQVIKEVQNQ